MTLSYQIDEKSVLPEVLLILDEMIRLYNDFEKGGTYLKLNENPVMSPTSVDTFSSRYELYKTKEDLMEAIVANCPTGCTLLQDEK